MGSLVGSCSAMAWTRWRSWGEESMQCGEVLWLMSATGDVGLESGWWRGRGESSGAPATCVLKDLGGFGPVPSCFCMQLHGRE